MHPGTYCPTRALHPPVLTTGNNRHSPGLVPVSADSPGARRGREVGKRLQVGRQVEPGQAPGQSVRSALPVALLRAVWREEAREGGSEGN